jgi:antibiotic biosynthesis monooxygenase (ABM) superfamily enzyme
MFINLIEFPPIAAGKDEEFHDWFTSSNTVYARFPGFISRRLLKSSGEDAGYWAIVEHESEDSFMAMHTSPERAGVWSQVEPLLVGRPSPRFFEVVASTESLVALASGAM